jgi:endo-1,4-beta-D-glucanase Y
MPTLSYLQFVQLRSLLLVSVLPVLALACSHPSTVGNGDNGTGGGLGNGAGGSSAGHTGSGGANGRAGSGGSGPSAAGGAGGVAGTGGISSTGGSGPTRGPAPPLPGMKFPFPQNRQSANCVYPTGYTNDVVVAAYNKWKADTVTTAGAGGFRRVKRTQSDYTGAGGLELESTVSEGIAYGMLIAVYMNDQALFDDLWKYEQLWPNDKTGLMDWYINAAGTMRLGLGPATDADEDMAFALVMANRQWGGKGALASNYIDIAKDVITKIWNHEIYQSKLLRPGNWGDWATVNISYFAPAYYRVFDVVDTDTTHDWPAVIQTAYDTIGNALNAGNKNQSNGLVPAWCSSDGAPNGGALGIGQTAPTNYQYDSCRTPFRIALDWCWFGTTAARDYTAKTSAFFSGIGAANIADGYNLDGTARPQHAGQRSAAFIGPAGVGAMTSSTYQTLVDQSYATVASGTALAGGAYYEESWTVLSLLMMTGNFLDYTAL